MFKQYKSGWYIPVLMLVMLMFTACNDNPRLALEQAGAAFNGNSVQGGGISGTGISTGVIKKFGKVFVNGKEYDIAESVKKIKGVLNATEADFNLGMKVTLKIKNGKVVFIEYTPEVKGAITKINLAEQTIEVLGQTISLNDLIELQNLASIKDIKVGDIVEISGFSVNTGNILATYIKREDNSDNGRTVEIKGTVRNNDPEKMQFQIGRLTIDYSNITLSAGLVEKSQAKVEGILDGTVPNLLIATSLEQENSPSEELEQDDDFDLEGVVSGSKPLNPLADFVINNTQVVVTADTVFQLGSMNDLTEHTVIEVRGRFNRDGLLQADVISFVDNKKTRFRIAGQVDTASINLDELSLTVLGIKVFFTPGTVITGVDNPDIATLTDGDFLKIIGFTDKDNNLIAVKVKKVEQESESSVESTIGTKNKADATISMLSVTVDILNAELKKVERSKNNAMKRLKSDDNDNGDQTDDENDVKIVASTDITADNSTDQSVDSSTDISTDNSSDQSVDSSTDISTDNSTDQSVDSSTDISTDNSSDQSVDNSTDSSTDNSTDQSVDSSTDNSSDQSVDNSTDNSTDSSTDNSSDQSVDNSTDISTDSSTDISTDNSTDQSVDNSTDSSTDNRTDQSVDNNGTQGLSGSDTGSTVIGLTDFLDTIIEGRTMAKATGNMESDGIFHAREITIKIKR